MKKKIKIGYTKKTDVDFGRLAEWIRDGTIKVSEEFWTDYLDKRFAFETLHSKLLDKIPPRRREGYFKKELEEIDIKRRKAWEENEKKINAREV